MKKDIPFHPVTGVYMAIAYEEKHGEREWAVYLINKNLISLHSVMVTSKGYGKVLGEQRQTSTLRHVIEKLEASAYARVEPIEPEVFALNNEFWVSYYFWINYSIKNLYLYKALWMSQKWTLFPS